MSDVLEINDPRRLAEYRLAWNWLLPQTPRATFFHTFDWLETYWQHFGQGQKLRVLVVHSHGKPVGIVPLCVRTARYRVGRVRTLNFPLSDWGNWYSAIGPNQAAVMMLAMQHVRRSRRDWDMITLDWNGPVAGDRGRPGRAMRVAGLAARKEICRESSIVRFSGTWEEYLAARSAKVRHEVRRKLRRVLERNDVQFVRHRPAPASCGDGDPRWDLFDMCQQVAAESWQAGVDDGNTLSSPPVRNFLRDAHSQAARLGMVDMNLLLVGGEPAAFAYNYHYDGRLFGVRIGYAPRFRSLGVGIALLLRTIQDSFDRDDTLLDLGGGETPFKKTVRTEVALGYRLTHTPLASLRSQAVRLTQWAKRSGWKSEDGGNKSVSGVQRRRSSLTSAL